MSMSATRLGLFLRPLSRRALFHTRQAGRLLQKASDNAAAAATKSNAQVKDEAPKKGLKALMKKYGYSALGVYLGLSAIDLPLSFMLVHSVGTDKIVEYENDVKRYFGFEPAPVDSSVTEAVEGVAEAVQPEGWRKYINPTLLTEFGIAYALHKSLIFIRVPLTAAITPGTVRTLQKWGFNIGKKAASAAK